MWWLQGNFRPRGAGIFISHGGWCALQQTMYTSYVLAFLCLLFERDGNPNLFIALKPLLFMWCLSKLIFLPRNLFLFNIKAVIPFWKYFFCNRYLWNSIRKSAYFTTILKIVALTLLFCYSQLNFACLRILFTTSVFTVCKM